MRLCRCYRSTVSKRALQSSCSSSGRTWSTNSAHADADAKRTGAAALRCTRWACLDHVVLRCTVPQPCAARAGLTTHRTASCARQRALSGGHKQARVGRRRGWVWWFGWEHRWLGLGIRVCEVLSERRQAAVSIRAHWPKRVAHAQRAAEAQSRYRPFYPQDRSTRWRPLLWLVVQRMLQPQPRVRAPLCRRRVHPAAPSIKRKWLICGSAQQ